MKKLMVLSISLIVVMVLAMAGFPNEVTARPLNASSPGLGYAGSFSVLAGVSTNSANTSTLEGDLGLYPGVASSRTGYWVVGGSEYFGPGTTAQDAQGSALSAFLNMGAQGSNGAWGGNHAPPPGVWTDSSSPSFTGTLTLEGDYEDVWVFQIADSLTFDGNVVMAGDAQPCHVFWQVAESATIASGSKFVGTLIASTSVTVVSGAKVKGRIIALNGSVTLDNNVINMPSCASAPAAPPSTGDTTDAEAAAVGGLPNAGGAPYQDKAFPWELAVVFGGLSIITSILVLRTMRRNDQMKQ